MARGLPQEDPLVRMQRDLKRALQKNPTDIKWGMVIDIAKRIGCAMPAPSAAWRRINSPQGLCTG